MFKNDNDNTTHRKKIYKIFLKYNLFEKSRKSQITIFVILALIIVIAVLIIFAFRNPPKPVPIVQKNPHAYIEACTRQAVEEALTILMPQGGDINPKGTIRYNGTDIVYHCYINEYYKKCYNQRPLLIEHIEKEITNYIQPKVANCFLGLQNNLKGQYDEIKSGDMKITTRLFPKHVVVDIDKDFKMVKGGEVSELYKFNKFRMDMINPIYDLAHISMEISNQEAKYCNFDSLGFMILYPDYNIDSKITGDSDTIYKVKERSTNQEFTFAVRSCKMPPGF